MEAEGDIDFSSDSGKHKLATIMFSDICGFTRMMGKDEKKTMEIVEQNKLIHQRAIHMHNGDLIKEMGDGLMASFESTHDAVRCAKSILEEVNEKGNYSLHIGIHLGEIIFTREDIFGDGVNIAARINACASDGEIVVSEEVWKNIKNQTEFRSVYLGKRTLKNVDHHVKLYRILLDEEKKSIQFKAVYHTYSNKIKFGIASVLIASLILIVFYYVQSPLRLNSGKRTIAVLPFDNRSELDDFEYLRESLAEDVISQLFNLSSYTVISSRSSFKYKDSDRSLKQISKELKADIILIGNFSIQNQNVDVRIELIEGSDNEILNYGSISSNLTELGEISSQISENIFETLNIHEEKSKESKSVEKQNVNIEAYKYNAMGRSAMHDHTGQSLEDITQYFEAAIKIDSTYAEPYLGMAEAYIFDVNRGYLSPAEGAQKARKYALIAERLKPGSGEVSGIMGIIHSLDYKYEQSVPYFERSLEISPNYDLTYIWYSFTLEALGDFDKAEQLQRSVTILDPLNAFNEVYLVLNYIFQDRLADAEKLVNSMISMNPNHMETLWIQAVLLIQKEEYDQAYQVLLNRGIGLETNFVTGYTYSMIGQEEKAKVVLNNMLKKAEKGYVPPTQIAIVLCGLKKYDQALDQIEQAFLVHDQWIGWAKFTNMTNPIKDSPRFENIMNNIGFK